MQEVSRDEAIAMARVAAFMSNQLNGIDSAVINSNKNIAGNTGEISVDKILSGIKIATPPPPPGPVIDGLGGEKVVLHEVQGEVVDAPIQIDNPFAKASSQNKPMEPLQLPVGKSPIANIMRTTLLKDPGPLQVTDHTVEKTPDVLPSNQTPTNEQILKLIIEKLVTIELKLNKLIKKKKNENKSPQG